MVPVLEESSQNGDFAILVGFDGAFLANIVT
jgi:hypothetical protein